MFNKQLDTFIYHFPSTITFEEYMYVVYRSTIHLILHFGLMGEFFSMLAKRFHILL